MNQDDEKQNGGAVLAPVSLLGISGIPSLCSSSYCVGCGNQKLYRGKDASSLVCCNDCWKKIPKRMREQFTNDHKRPDMTHGATIWENRIAVTLLWFKDA